MWGPKSGPQALGVPCSWHSHHRDGTAYRWSQARAERMALQGFTGFTRVEVSSFICSPITQVFQWGEKLVSCLLKKKKVYLFGCSTWDLHCIMQDLFWFGTQTLQLWRTGSGVTAHTLRYSMACEILVPQPGIEPKSPALEDRLSTIGLQGKSQFLFLPGRSLLLW